MSSAAQAYSRTSHTTSSPREIEAQALLKAARQLYEVHANGQLFTFSISNVSGFRAKARYQSGSVHNYQDVLIKDNSFRIGDSKFALQRNGVAQIKTVMTDPVSGASTLETSYANQR